MRYGVSIFVKKKYLQMKAQSFIVWHEFGHVFGYILVDKMYGDYRKIAKIVLVNKELVEGKENSQIAPNIKDKIQTDTDEIETIKAILILVMGAVFHVTKFKENKDIGTVDFSSIFTCINRKLDINQLYGYAGSDFEKIEYFLNTRVVPVERFTFLKFTEALQRLLKKHNVFDILKYYIVLFDEAFNGKTEQGNDLFKEERNKIKALISIELIKDLEVLIKEYF